MPSPDLSAFLAGSAKNSSGNLDRLRDEARLASKRSNWEASNEAWKAVLKRHPRDIEALGNLALNASACGEMERAIELWKEAIAIAPRNAGLWGNLAEVHRLRLQLPEAEKAIRKAISLAPAKVDLPMALANILWDDRKIAEALAASRQVPDQGELGSTAANLRGNLFSHLGYGALAREEFAHALELRPGHAPYASNHLLALLYDETLAEEEIFAEHESFGRQFETGGEPMRLRNPDPCRPLRIGILSADFRIHSVGYFIEPLLEAMDRKRYPVTLYSMVAKADQMTNLISSHVERVVPVMGLSPEQFAARCAEDEIDILIELSGHTGGNCLPALAHRLAPIQLSWLGYPHTTGLKAIDGRLSDAVIEPLPESQNFSTEQVWHIPGGAHVYRMPGKPVPLTALPLQQKGHPTFICCNNSAKISPSTLHLWARLLREVPDARLLLKNSGFVYPERGAEVLRFFAEAGVTPGRVEIRPLADSVRKHVEMYGEADIALDTFPYNGTTTTCEALWMGVPVVTLLGHSARARHSASLLHQVGLDDWICASEDALVERVKQAVADPAKLATLRAGLRERFQHSTLGHSVSFAGRFQATLRRIWTAKCQSTGASDAALAAGLAAAQKDENRGGAALDLARAQWLDQTGDHEAAIDAWRRVALSGFASEAWPELVRRLLPQQDDSLIHRTWQEATAVHPAEAAFWAARAEAARSAGDLEDAAQSYREALERAPDSPGVWMNLSGVLRSLNRPVAAEGAARRAVALKEDFAEAWNNLGCALRDQARFDESVEAFCTGLNHSPNHALLHSNLVYLLNFVPGLSTADLRDQHAVFDQNQFSGIVPHPTMKRPARQGGPLRIGFLSSDLRQHSVGYFLRAAFPALRQLGVELVVFADVAMPDALSNELRGFAHRWFWTSGTSDEDLAGVLREQELDVLVELNGHTAGNRQTLLAHRVAPLQVSWLGYPCAPGTRGIDGFVADNTIYPPHEIDDGILRLADCALPYALPEDLPSCVSEVPAPDRPLTFGAFHNFPKLNDGVWQNWIELLQAFPQSRLLLKCRQLSEDAARRQWEARLAAWSAPLDRIEVLPYAVTQRLHLDAYQDVDFALDPSPYNGVTTTMEALAMGVPVLTIPGSTPASRHAASLLQTYAKGQGICADQAALIFTVQRESADLAAFRGARPARARAFAAAIDAQRPRWAQHFLSVLEAALVSKEQTHP